MDIQTSKIELARLILSIENPILLRKISDLVLGHAPDFWDKLSKSEQAEIRLGLDQLDRGEGISYEEFLRKVS